MYHVDHKQLDDPLPIKINIVLVLKSTTNLYMTYGKGHLAGCGVYTYVQSHFLSCLTD